MRRPVSTRANGFAKDVRGVAIVEFAIVMPILLLLLVGIFELGRAYNAYATVRSASAEGAHWAALHPGAAMSEIEAAVLRRVVPLDTRRVSVEAWYDDGTAYVRWDEGGIPASGPSKRIVPIRVQVSYPWSAVTFLFSSVLPERSATFTATTTADAMR